MKNSYEASLIVISLGVMVTSVVCVLYWYKDDWHGTDDLSSTLHLTARPQQISDIEFPPSVNFRWSHKYVAVSFPQSFTSYGYLVTRGDDNHDVYGDMGMITITDLSTKASFEVHNVIHDVPGDGFVAWLSVPQNDRLGERANSAEFSSMLLISFQEEKRP